MNADKMLARAIMLDDREWSVQGFGVLRTYLKGGNIRLHIWDPQLAVPDVTEVHSHPWHLRSRVVAGNITNELWREMEGEPTHWRGELKAGENAFVKSKDAVRLVLASRLTYAEGEEYSQAWDAVHRSCPAPYAVTLIERRVPEENHPDWARTYWPVGQEWVNAVPRPATDEEVEFAVGEALERWF